MLGKCECEFAIIDEIVKIVAEGLLKLDNILCAVALESFKAVAEIGVNFVPGAGQASTATWLSVERPKRSLRTDYRLRSSPTGSVRRATLKTGIST